MRLHLGSLLVLALLACRPPWPAPGAHFDTKAGHADTLFTYICNYHINRFHDDKINVVYKISIDQRGYFVPTTATKVTMNEKGLVRPTQKNSGIYVPLESWVVGTELGNRYEYHVLIGNNSYMLNTVSNSQDIEYNYHIVNFIKLDN